MPDTSNVLSLFFSLCLVVASFLTFLAICVQAFIYNAQLKEMRKSTDAATKAARAAEDSVVSARETSHLDQRAWLTVRAVTMKTPLAAGQIPIIEVRFENTGRTPALNVQTSGAIFSHQNVRPEDLPSRGRAIAGEASRSTVGPSQGETAIFYAKEPITDDAQVKSILDESWVIYVSGRVVYDDIFSKHHQTAYCYTLSGREAGALRLSASFDGNTVD